MVSKGDWGRLDYYKRYEDLLLGDLGIKKGDSYSKKVVPVSIARRMGFDNFEGLLEELSSDGRWRSSQELLTSVQVEERREEESFRGIPRRWDSAS
jgi:hypothetical protein